MSLFKLSHRFTQGGTPVVNHPVSVTPVSSNTPARIYADVDGARKFKTSYAYTDVNGEINVYVALGGYRLTLRSPDLKTVLAMEEPVYPEEYVSAHSADQKALSDNVQVLAGPSINNFTPDKPMFIAHRGSPLVHPEHSMQGYLNTLRDPKLVAIEQDVQATSDGELVVMHDGTIDRTTTGTGNVSAQTTATWKALAIDARDQGIPGFGNTVRAPFFREPLQAFRGRAIFTPEIKTSSVKQSTVDMLLSYGIPYDQAMIQSFTMTDLIPAQEAGYPAAFLTSNATALAAAITQGLKWVALDQNTPAADIQAWKDAGFKLIFWTVNRRYLRDTLAQYRPHAYFTDDASYMARYEPYAYTDAYAVGRYMPGMLHALNSTTIAARGDFRQNKWWGWYDPAIVASASFVLQGWAGPLTDYEWSVQFDMRINAVNGGDQSRWGSVFVADAAMNDRPFNDAGNTTEKGYHLLMRKNGQLMIYRFHGTGSSASVAAQSPSNANVTYAMTDGVTYPFKVTVRKGYVKIARLNASGAEVHIAEYRDPTPWKPEYFHFGRQQALPEFSNVVVKVGQNS